MAEFKINNETFNLYYDQAKRARENGDFPFAKRNYLLASETLLQLAKEAPIESRLAYYHEAEELMKLANRLEEEDIDIGREIKQYDKWDYTGIPDIDFSDIAGLDEAKKALSEYIKNKQLNTGILLYGPYGCGKTMLIKALGKELGAVCYGVITHDILSRDRDEVTENLLNFFNKAAQKERAIIFFDQIDLYVIEKEEFSFIQNELYQKIKEYMSEYPNILFASASNCPWKLSRELKELFTNRIYIGLPEETDRRQMIEKSLSKFDLDEALNTNLIVEATRQFTASEVMEFCDILKEGPAKKSVQTSTEIRIITQADFNRACMLVKAGMTDHDLSLYENLDE